MYMYVDTDGTPTHLTCNGKTHHFEEDEWEDSYVCIKIYNDNYDLFYNKRTKKVFVQHMKDMLSYTPRKTLEIITNN